MTGLVDTLPWGGWALDRHTAVELAAWLDHIRPGLVVEAGSGATTVVLADYATRTGAKVVSLEHDGRYLARTADLLAQHRLGGVVDLRHAPLSTVDTPDGPAPWYDTVLPDGIGMALVDGPPGTVGRQGALYALWPHLADGAHVWLDDADRPGEQAALSRWARHLPVRIRLLPLPRGLAVVGAGNIRPSTVDASDVAVTILTGRRPDLLAATVASLTTAAPGLLQSAHVTVLHNGTDAKTAALLDGWPWVDAIDTHHGSMLPVGAAVSRLAAALPDRPLWLHLEDDWTAATTVPGWLDVARDMLADPQVGQVRLRHRGQPVHTRHMTTGQPIRWTRHHPGALVGEAHYTCNPSLMRTADAVVVWPADSERAAMHTFATRGWQVAQLDPGVFHHTGAAQSLEGHVY